MKLSIGLIVGLILGLTISSAYSSERVAQIAHDQGYSECQAQF